MLTFCAQLIVRGEGGAHAIRDALNLSKILGQVDISDSRALFEAIGTYHAEILERGVEAVRKSRVAHTTFDPENPRITGWGHVAVPIPLETISLSDL
jgi:2-polyprenyl-6-methoxyphenol hydroxylase-like FAD-dependent oxidoreductase